MHDSADMMNAGMLDGQNPLREWAAAFHWRAEFCAE